MDMDRLRQLIEAEVRKILAAEDSAMSSGGTADLLVLFTGASIGLDGALSALRTLSTQGYRLTAVLCPMAVDLVAAKLQQIPGLTEVITDERTSQVETMIAACEAVLIPILSRTAAAKLALGIADNLVLALTMHALTVGKPVIAARNAADPGTTDDPAIATPQPLIRLAKNYLQTLESFGVQFTDVSRLSQHFDPEMSQQYAPGTKGKTLITESVIANLSPGVRELVIPNPAIITPLAQDLARERNITLRMAESK